jgi:hypothetical protein
MDSPENLQHNPQSIITISRVCNMLGEVSKSSGSFEVALSYYLKGIHSDPLGNADNFYDLAELYESLDHPDG